MAATVSQDVAVEMTGISKTYPGVQALNEVSFCLLTKEIHAIVGANGAGKSTLVKILFGAEQPDCGELRIDGVPRRFLDPAHAQREGIAYVPQEITLVEHQDAAHNVYLGQEPRSGVFVKSREIYARAQTLFARLGLTVDPHTLARDLSTPQRQMVLIAKAVSRGSRVIILDEPTTSLSYEEQQSLFKILRVLSENGTSIIYVSHRLQEVLDLAHRVTVLRNGRLVRTVDSSDVDVHTLVHLMVGGETYRGYPDVGSSVIGDVLLEVVNLQRLPKLANVSLSVRSGEVVGIAGLVGSGRTEILRCIIGADSISGGQIHINGEPVELASPADALAHGVGLLVEDRRQQGLLLQHEAIPNASLPVLPQLSSAGFVISKEEAALTCPRLNAFNLPTEALNKRARFLSGGNQQKLLLTRWICSRTKILLLDEPTKGVDVGAKSEIYQHIARLCHDGLGVLLVSSDIDELVGLSHRVLVLSEGRIVREFARGDATAETVLATLLGGGA